MVRGGTGFGGADVEMGHELSKTESGKREKYISVSENQPMGQALSYFYARGFERPETKSLVFDANDINNSNVILEQWDALPKKEQKRLQEEYKFSREKLESIAERPHYFNPIVEKEKLFIYKRVVDTLQGGEIPDVSSGDDLNYEIHHLIEKMPNNKIIDKIFAKIKNEKEQYPDTSNEKFISEYKELFTQTERRLQEFEKLSIEEQNQKTNQNPVLLTLEKSKIDAMAKKTFIDKNEKEKPIHPSQQEARIYGDIDLLAISAIQAPEEILSKIQKAIDSKIKDTDDHKIKAHLKNIKLVPLELYEVERVIRKKVNEKK